MSRTGRIGGALFVGIISVALGYWLYVYSHRPVVRVFTGSLVSALDDRVVLRGVFAPPETGALPEAFLTEREFAFRLGAATTFERTEIRRPSPQQVMAMGGTYAIDDLPRVVNAGSRVGLAESREGASVYVEARFAKSILRVSEPVASHVAYRVMLPPQLPPSDGATSNE